MKGNDEQILQVAEDRVALLLEDPGKADTHPTPAQTAGGGSAWRRLLAALLLLGLGMIGGLYLQPLALRPILGLAGFDSLQSSVDPASEAERRPPADAAAFDVVALGRLVPEGGTLAVAFRHHETEGQRVAAGETAARFCAACIKTCTRG